MALDPVTGAFIRRGRFGDTHIHTKGREPCESKRRNWGDAAINQYVNGRQQPPEAKQRQGRILYRRIKR